MRILARLCLAVGGLSLALSASASAQAPGRYNAQAPSRSEDVVTIPTGVYASPGEAKAVEAQLRRMGPPTTTTTITTAPVVMEGAPIIIGQGGSTPGRAVVSDAPGFENMAAPGEPMPIGVMRTNYANGPQPSAMSMAPTGPRGSSPYNPMMGPGMGMGMGKHGVPTNPAVGSSPFLPSSTPPRPRIIAHLFGLEGIGNAMRDARESRMEARKRREMMHDAAAAHRQAELPASAVYGPGPR